MSQEVKAHRKVSRQYAQKYLGMAAIGEIAVVTPQNIRLINFKINAPGSAAPKVVPDKTTKETIDDVMVEGVIFGEREMLDSLLAQYVMKLENSPMFRGISVQKSGIVTFKKSEVLHFTLNAKIG